VSARGRLAEEVARLLRQRLETGDEELVLGSLDRVEALRLARAGRAAVAGGPAGSAAGETAVPAAGPRSPHRSSGSAAAAGGVSSGTGDPPSLTSLLRAELDAATEAEEEPTGPEAPGDPELPDDYEALRDLALGCVKCRLHETRTQVVFSDGVRDARLMVVGEAPGANEDATGLPFVGAAGQFLDLLLSSVGLSRKNSVYIANVLKCRPPGNRNPRVDEIGCCSPYLRKQIELVAPEAILAVGTFAGQLLTGRKKSLGRLRGEVYAYQGVPLLVTYHPAALLRNPRWTRPVWDDLQLLRSILDGG
jgi:DNA polymerase